MLNWCPDAARPRCPRQRAIVSGPGILSHRDCASGKIAGTADRDDVLTILPVQQMLEDAPFLQYLRASNLRSVSASAPPPRSREPGGRSRRLMCAAAKRG